jgi:alkanesulfonate monooxygenase SsuD/methylene tetrahydromethanopterin reductase-like flavin-dependent oxidoreductase (luciferase family)
VGDGAGNRDELLRKLGLSESGAAERSREAVLVARGVLRGEEVRYRSETLVADPVRLLCAPARPVPVFIGARGRLLLRAAGEVADGVVFGGFFTDAALAYGRGCLAEGLSRAGRQIGDVSLMVWGSCYITAPDDVPDVLRRTMSISLGRAPVNVLDALGMNRDRMQLLKAAYHAGGGPAVAPLLTRQDMEVFALLGTPAEIRARIRTMAAAGIVEIGLLLSHETEAAKADYLRTFAAEILEPLRREALASTPA